MNAIEFTREIVNAIAEGDIRPDAPVVMADEDGGHIAVKVVVVNNKVIVFKPC